MTSPENPRSSLDRTHMNTVSTFGQKFPVDTGREEILFIVETQLPEAIKSGLTLQGCHQITSSLIDAGGVQLFPAAAATRLENTDNPEDTDLKKSHETLRGLIEHRRLTLAHYEIASDNGYYTDFRIALMAQHGRTRRVYELTGTTEESPIGEFADFYLSTFDDDASDRESYFEIDDTLANLLLDAIISQQKHYVRPIRTGLQAKLQQVVEASPVRLASSAGNYELAPPQPLTVSLEHHEIFYRGLAKIASYMIYIEEQGETCVDGITYTTPRGLSLDYDEQLTPHYEAKIHTTFLDPNATVPHYVRDQTFDIVVTGFRERQANFFKALGSAAERLSQIG